MKPGDLIKVTYPNDVCFFWEVVGVFLGGDNQESVVELVPVTQKPNTEGRTLVPAQMLDVLHSGGKMVVAKVP